MQVIVFYWSAILFARMGAQVLAISTVVHNHLPLPFRDIPLIAWIVATASRGVLTASSLGMEDFPDF